MGLSPTIMNQLEYFGHIMRHPDKYGYLHLIREVNIIGKRPSGRKGTAQLFFAPANKTIIMNKVANMITHNR